ncbi:MarR family transcriptional regulator, partial [Amycolatopsis mediterranei]
TLAPGTDARVANAHDRLAALDKRAVAGFTPAEVATLKDLLTRLGNNLDRAKGAITDEAVAPRSGD